MSDDMFFDDEMGYTADDDSSPYGMDDSSLYGAHETDFGQLTGYGDYGADTAIGADVSSITTPDVFDQLSPIEQLVPVIPELPETLEEPDEPKVKVQYDYAHIPPDVDFLDTLEDSHPALDYYWDTNAGAQTWSHVDWAPVGTYDTPDEAERDLQYFEVPGEALDEATELLQDFGILVDDFDSEYDLEHLNDISNPPFYPAVEHRR
jgi:hypothetical protein